MFKGRFATGEVIEYFHGAEAGLKKEYFKGEKIIFLLAEPDEEKKTIRYSVLENSTDWSGVLPKSGVYEIMVFPQDEATNTTFTLEIAIR